MGTKAMKTRVENDDFSEERYTCWILSILWGDSVRPRSCVPLQRQD